MSQAPPPDLLLRAARPDDAEAIAALHNLPGFRWGTLRLPFETPEQVRARFDKAGPEVTTILATLDGQLVGSASLQRYAGRRAHAGSIGMGVHDGWTGRGIGSALLAALLDTADNWLGLRRVELTVWTDNAPALALYGRFGFVVEGTYAAYALREGRFVDAFAMARLRAAPAA